MMNKGICPTMKGPTKRSSHPGGAPGSTVRWCWRRRQQVQRKLVVDSTFNQHDYGPHWQAVKPRLEEEGDLSTVTVFRSMDDMDISPHRHWVLHTTRCPSMQVL